MAETLTAEQAAARVRPVDTLGLPLGPGQPPAFLQALGERDDWEDLRVSGALLVGRHGAVHARGRPLPVGLLRPDRADAARRRREHQLRARPTSAASRRCWSAQRRA